MSTTIRANAAVTDALKPLVSNRVWPFVAPETNPGAPYITYTPISSQRLQTLDGYAGHNQVSMQIDIWADDIETTTRLAETVIQLLEARSDISARVQQDRDDHDSTTNLVRKSLDFLIWEQTQ
jgi:hypothetical protein